LTNFKFDHDVNNLRQVPNKTRHGFCQQEIEMLVPR